MKKAHERSRHRFAAISRHSLRNGFNGFLRALLGDRALLPPSPAEYFRELDASVGASGPHDFAVREIDVIRRLTSHASIASRTQRPWRSRYAPLVRAGRLRFCRWFAGTINACPPRPIGTTGKSVGDLPSALHVNPWKNRGCPPKSQKTPRKAVQKLLGLRWPV